MKKRKEEGKRFNFYPYTGISYRVIKHGKFIYFEYFIMIKEVIFFTVIGNITRDIRTVFFNLDQLLNINSFIKNYLVL